MKKIVKTTLLAACLIVFSHKAQSQVMAQKLQWITIKSANLKCWVCKQKLESYLMKVSIANYESGIAQVKFNLMQGEVKIQYYPDRIEPDDLKIIIRNAGFDAENEKANPDSYKKLPPECKYAAEGGGPQKGKPCQIEPNE